MLFNAVIVAVVAAVASVHAAPAAADTNYGDGEFPHSSILRDLPSDIRSSSPAATYYYPNGGYGACGAPLQNTDFIVALSADQYAGGANCWRHIGVNCECTSVLYTASR